MAQRVVLITGCSEREGLGHAIAMSFLKEKFMVFATARKIETLDVLKGAGCQVLALDVTDQASIQAAVNSVQDNAGRLDILVNIAAQSIFLPLLDTPISTMQSVFAVDVLGLLAMTQAFTPLLIESRSVEGPKPTVMNIGSVAAIGVPWGGPIAVCKAAVHCLSDVMRREMGPLGIRVVLIHLGAISSSTAIRLFRTEPTLPSSSPYADTWPSVVQKLNRDGTQQIESFAWSPADAAKDIVRAATGSQRVVFTAFGWQAFKFVLPYLSYGTVDWLMGKLRYTAMATLPIGKRQAE